MCMVVVFTCIYTRHLYAWSLRCLEDSFIFPRTRVTDGWVYVCAGTWNPVLWKSKQPAILAAEPSLQPLSRRLSAQFLWLRCSPRRRLIAVSSLMRPDSSSLWMSAWGSAAYSGWPWRQLSPSSSHGSWDLVLVTWLPQWGTLPAEPFHCFFVGSWVIHFYIISYRLLWLQNRSVTFSSSHRWCKI